MTTPTFVPSPEQQQVIAHRGGHLQVVACAGAGIGGLFGLFFGGNRMWQVWDYVLCSEQPGPDE